MRTLEIITAILLFFSLIRTLFRGRPRWIDLLPYLTVVSAILQILIEGYRWQLVPIYGISLILFVFSFGGIGNSIGNLFKKTWEKAIVWTFAVLFLIAAIALPVLLPIPRLPESSGQYQVGTFSVMLTDPSRLELYSDDASEQRSIMVQVWYPANPSPDDQLAPWMEWIQSPKFIPGYSVRQQWIHRCCDRPYLWSSPDSLPGRKTGIQQSRCITFWYARSGILADCQQVDQPVVRRLGFRSGYLGTME